MHRRIFLLLVPLLTVAIVALGLRTGAKDETVAAIVTGAPLPRGGERLAWTLSTFREASGVREVISQPFSATFTSKGRSVTVNGVTSDDGFAELGASMPGLAAADPLALTVTDPAGTILAKGDVAWGTEARAETRVLVHATVREGELDVDLAAWGARLATAHDGVLWVRATDKATGQPVRMLRAEIDSDPALTIVEPFHATCNDLAGTIKVVPNMHVATIDLRVTSETGKTGRFYGQLPIAPGAFWVDAPNRAEPGPLSFRVAAPNAHPRAYVEVDDEVGRLMGTVVPLASDATDPVPHALVTTPPLSPGLHWLVVSGEPDGAVKLDGATRAIPLRVGAPAECDEPFAGRVPTSLPRFVAVDGFATARIPARERRATGRKIVLGAVTAGLGLEFLLVAAALRRRPKIGSEGDRPATRSRAFDAVSLLLLSALGFLLLFALLESQTR